MIKKSRHKRLFTNIIVIACIMAIIAMISYLIGKRNAPPIHITQTTDVTMLNETFADFTFKNLNGDTLNITDFQGRVVLLNFWASWCAPCLVELPQFYELAAQNSDDMTVILMSVDFDRKNIDKILQKLKLSGQTPDNLILAWDPNKKVSKDIFGTIVYPETILINRNGRMVHKVTGAIDWFEQDIQTLIKKASE